jgi:hypothetical protein
MIIVMGLFGYWACAPVDQAKAVSKTNPVRRLNLWMKLVIHTPFIFYAAARCVPFFYNQTEYKALPSPWVL